MKHFILVVSLLCCVMAMQAATASFNTYNAASLQGYVTDAADGDTGV